MNSDIIIETERLILLEFNVQDAAFFFELVNDPAWIRYIGDRNVNHIEDAEKYLTERIIPSYQEFGYGFYLVRTKESDTSIGMSGLIKREGLDHTDIGYAFLPSYRGKGFAFEATKGVLDYGKDVLNINPIVAITDLDNVKSIRLLKKLGFQFDQIIQIPEGAKNCRLYKTK